MGKKEIKFCESNTNLFICVYLRIISVSRPHTDPKQNPPLRV